MKKGREQGQEQRRSSEVCVCRVKNNARRDMLDSGMMFLCAFSCSVACHLPFVPDSCLLTPSTCASFGGTKPVQLSRILTSIFETG